MITSPYRTKLTRDMMEGVKNPSRNPINRKPYRTPQQKANARKSAYRAETGEWRSPTPVSYH